MQSEIRIEYYEEWMKPQIAALFEAEYTTNKATFETFFSKFYEHAFQKNKCIRIVALDQDKVVGFQSFFYWPYVLKGKVFASYQSGNSLVHPDYRGKGLFKKVLNFIYTGDTKNEIDFIMGFPVEASFPSFIKNGWLNIVDLRWSIKLINPFAFLFSINRVEKRFLQTYTPITGKPFDFIKLSDDSKFTEWRKNYSSDKIVFFVVKENQNELCFNLKCNKRSKFINELIIGDITSTTYDELFLSACFKQLIKEARRSLAASILSIAINEHIKDKGLLHALNKNGFKFLNKRIHFIIKPVKENSDELKDPKNWMLLRSDIDTW